MNASASAMTRDVEIQSKIRKVSTFGRYARVVCSVIYGFGVVACAGMLLMGIVGLFLPGLHGPMSDSGLSPQQKLWALSISGVVMGLGLAAVYQLYRLFGNLAAGAIYTAENVVRVRRVGFLWLLSAIFGVLIPVVWTGLIALGLVEASDPPKEIWFSWSDSLASFMSAGLILLVSWVMDVGLYEKDHAEALRRDADLVI
ncbi:MAG TPA: DUF2975 domain-containing protein [Steroidobacteraceae bacterium]|nr:DUF2975 domain-containing protein [Steroidobacteraceae bacterium]